MFRWTGLAPWDFEFPFPGSLTSTFLRGLDTLEEDLGAWLSGRTAPNRAAAKRVQGLEYRAWGSGFRVEVLMDG